MIQIQARKASGILDKTVGLIGKNVHTEALFFQTRWGIHTFGLKFPIDVVILDSENVVVKLYSGLAPNRIYLWNPKYCGVVEMEKGELQKKKIKIGSVIMLVSK